MDIFMIIFTPFLGGDYIQNIDLLDRIVDYIDHSPDRREGSMLYGMDKNVKDCFDLPLENNRELFSEYVKELNRVVDQYVETYPMSVHYSTWGLVEGINIQHYPPKGHYNAWHCERSRPDPIPNVSRHLVFMTYLNDVSLGGETEWLHQEIKIKPKKGLTVIWPVDWTFTHRGLPTLEDKYIVTGWFSYVNRK